MARNHWDTYTRQVCQEMGHQWRTRYAGTLQHAPDHVLGYSPRSIFDRLKVEQEGAGQNHFRQRYAEFFTGIALEGRRAIQSLDGQARTAVEWHFFAKGVPVKLKAHHLGWKVSTYWWRLNRGMEQMRVALSQLDKIPAPNVGQTPPRNARFARELETVA